MKTKPEQRSKEALSRRPPSTDYEVGYGKPSVARQFAAGQSGNPRGRPKGSKNRPKLPGPREERLKTIILEEAYRTIRVSDAKGTVSIPMAQAVIRSLAVNAAKGNQRAQRLFAELLTSVESSNRRQHDEWLQVAIEYKTGWEQELERRKAHNIVAPDPIPHPDDIVINPRTGHVEIKGPMTKEEKQAWDELRERKAKYDQSIVELEALLREQPDFPHRQQVLEDIKQDRRMSALIASAIPDRAGIDLDVDLA
jgi:Family of unknown function (DUF5681)